MTCHQTSGVEGHVSAAFRRENVAFHGSEDEVLAIAAEAGPAARLAVAGLSVAALLAIWFAFFSSFFCREAPLDEHSPE